LSPAKRLIYSLGVMHTLLSPGVISIIACPACKGELRVVDEGLLCRSCSHVYRVSGGIPELLPLRDSATIDPSSLRIKTKEEASRTIAEMTGIDSGFLRSARVFYGIYLLCVVFAVARWPLGIAAVVVILLADWLVFRVRRGRVLHRDAANPFRLQSACDYGAVDDAYRREGRAQPRMSDWVKLAGESLGNPTGDSAEEPDDERYQDILRVYGARAQPADVVVDVGANDGRACFQFGIGRDAVFVGIDVSRLLLEEFLRNLPEKTAIQAEGGCLPLRDGVVDFLFCTETLEHIADPGAAMTEFVRVLKPGGRLMVQSPNAHRIRNLNAFHILTLFISLTNDRVLLKKVVHENTWHNAATYHWDFSRHDYKRMLGGQPSRITELYSRSFFFPGFLIRGRIDRYQMKERVLGSIPALRLFGGDLVVVAEKL